MRMGVPGFVTFIGVELHKCIVTLRAARADGELLGQLKCDTECGERIAEWIKALPGPKWLAVEACPFVEWFIDRFTPCVDRLDIADATALSMRRGKQRLAFGNYLDQILLIERQREILRREMLTAARSPQCAATEQYLKSVPGIGPIWALIIASEVGPFDRIPNADALEFWAGMTADLKESAGRTQSGNIAKAGSATLRWALCQAAVTLCQSDARQEATRQRFIARMPKAKATRKARALQRS